MFKSLLLAGFFFIFDGMSITFTSKIGHLTKLKLHYIVVSEDVLDQFKSPDDAFKFNQRFIIRVNDQVEWQAGTTSLGNRSAYITLSANRMKELGVARHDRVSITLVKDESEYGFTVPEEFEAVLAQDIEGNQRFQSMSKGKRRAIIYLIVQIKSSEKRIDKSLFFIENLKRAPRGKETMRHALGKDLH